jgi:hypothetical protein
MIDYGIRSGGGIGDQLPMVSYRNNTEFFFQKWFFDILFHIFIVLILGNIFLGIIVDAFGELRDKTEKDEEDRNEICFICQMTKYDTLKNQINFAKHRDEQHNMWNYVYFLTDIYCSKYQDLDRIQRDIYHKIKNNDISWIIVYEDSDKIFELEKKIKNLEKNLIDTIKEVIDSKKEITYIIKQESDETKKKGLNPIKSQILEMKVEILESQKILSQKMENLLDSKNISQNFEKESIKIQLEENITK